MIEASPEKPFVLLPGKTFVLDRIEDKSGVSGTGVVAFGVILPTGRVVLEWLTKYTSIAFYENFAEMILVHGHDGKTIVRDYILPREVKNG